MRKLQCDIGMKRSSALLLVTVAALPAFEARVAMRGFSAENARKEAQLESEASAIPDPTRMAEYMRFMAAEPHQAGSPRSHPVATYIENLLKGWDLDVAVE